MKVNDPNLAGASAAATGAQRALEPGRTAKGAGSTGAAPGLSGPGDDVHLSELVRSLRALAAESPEREAHIQNIARSYAQGNYRVDPEATAEGVIRDALANR